MTATAAPPPEPKAAFWEDIFEIFYAPSKVFARRDGGDILLPLIILVVVTGVIFFATRGLMAPVFDAESSRNIQAAMAKNPQLTQEQMQKGVEFTRKFAGFFVILATLIAPLILGIVLWLVGKIFSSKAMLGAAVMIAVFSYYPRIIQWLAMSVQAALLPPEKIQGLSSVSFSAARFVDVAHTSAAMLALLQRFDVFIIWSTVLLILGIRIKGGLTTGQAVAVGVIVFILGTLLPVLPALARG